MNYSVIVPCYNEARNLPLCALRLLEALDAGLAGKDFEVIFVCDGATDNTLDLLHTVNHPRARVLGYEKNQGKGYAVRYGMLQAKGDIRLFCDCDLAYGTDAVLAMLQKMEQEQCPICIASRRIHPEGFAGYTLSRKIISTAYYCLLRIITGLSTTDSQSGLKAFSGEAAEAIFSLAEVNRFAFDVELLLIGKKLGYRIAEMPAKIIENSPSSISMSDPFKMLRDMLRIRRRVRKMKLNHK